MMSDLQYSTVLANVFGGDEAEMRRRLTATLEHNLQQRDEQIRIYQGMLAAKDSQIAALVSVVRSLRTITGTGDPDIDRRLEKIVQQHT